MSKGSTFIGWLAGGTGIVLIYSAYKNQSPVETLRNTLTSNPAKPAAIHVIPSQSFENHAGISGGAADSRILAIANKQQEPTLIPIPTQPYLFMDRDAVASFMKVQAQYGRPIILGNTYRTATQQANAYAANPTKFAPEGSSLHERGLALDVDTKLNNVNDPMLLQAFTDNGWFRQGKLINGAPEVWHYSYGVAG